MNNKTRDILEQIQIKIQKCNNLKVINMCWIWYVPEQTLLPEAIFDYESSGIQGFEMLDEDWIDESSSSPPVMKITRNGKHVGKANHIVTTGQTHIVSAQMHDVIASMVSKKEVQFIRTTVRCGKESYNNFYFVRPMNKKKCTNVEKSDFEWFQEGEFYVNFRKIHFYPNCLESLDIARDCYSNNTVVSNQLKTELCKYFDCKNIFYRPEDLPPNADLLPWS